MASQLPIRASFNACYLLITFSSLGAVAATLYP